MSGVGETRDASMRGSGNAGGRFRNLDISGEGKLGWINGEETSMG